MLKLIPALLLMHTCKYQLGSEGWFRNKNPTFAKADTPVVHRTSLNILIKHEGTYE